MATLSIGTIDGKMPWHVTDGLTTSADGRVCPPFVVHAQPQLKPKRPGETAQRMKRMGTTRDRARAVRRGAGRGVAHGGGEGSGAGCGRSSSGESSGENSAMHNQ